MAFSYSYFQMMTSFVEANLQTLTCGVGCQKLSAILNLRLIEY